MKICRKMWRVLWADRPTIRRGGSVQDASYGGSRKNLQKTHTQQGACHIYIHKVVNRFSIAFYEQGTLLAPEIRPEYWASHSNGQGI